jgi:hypothetical protein
MRPWEEIHHDGRTGADGGVDIRAVERLADGTSRRWAIQCRRYKTAAAATLRKAVDDVVGGGEPRPDVLVVAVGCDVSKAARESFQEYTRSKGVQSAQLWTASTIEATLYAHRHDLLFAFFDVSLAGRAREREIGLSRQLAIKKRVSALFRDPKSGARVVIRSIDDDSYPEQGPSRRIPGGLIDTWFRLEFNRMYHGGVEFVLNGQYVAIAEDGTWDVLDTSGIAYDSTQGGYKFAEYVDPHRFTVKQAWVVGRIPFRNIVEIDEDGDREYHPYPHLYCRFLDQGRPYESIVHVIDGHTDLDPAKRARISGVRVR